MTTTRSGRRSADPLDRLLDRVHAARRRPEVEVRQVRDPQPVQLGRQVRQLDLELRAAAPSPPRTSPTRPRPQRRAASAARADGARSDLRASRAPAWTETTCRLNFSSDSSSPAATPTSCERWRIGISKSRPVAVFELRLPRVEREVAERARRHHRVGAGLHRLLDRLDQLAERGLLARLDDREAAALDLRRVVDRLAAARLDDPLERRRAVGILEAQDLRRAQDLAAVERRDLEALAAPCARPPCSCS